MIIRVIGLNKNNSIDIIPEAVTNEWQSIIDLTAKIVNIPAALIMRVVKEDIEVFISSHSPNNPYHPGDKEHLIGSGLYCETVINTQNKLLIPNALKSEKWKNNPDIKLNMISYLGFPINYPNGDVFGTFCILDSQENGYSTTIENLMIEFRKIIQGQLEMFFINKELGDKNKQLMDYLGEIKTLRDIVPICVSCKKVRDDKGYWHNVEKYVKSKVPTKFTHGLCQECSDKLYGDQEWYQKQIGDK